MIAQIMEAVGTRRHELAAAMMEAIRSEITTYGELEPGPLVDDVMDQCEQHARLLPRVLGEGRAPTRDELAFARGAATRRVHDGIPLDAFLQAFRAAHGAMWDAIVAEAAQMPDGHTVAFPLARALIDYIDIASSHVAQAYLHEEQRVRALADRQRRDLLEGLLQGRLPSDPGQRHPAAPGLDPTGALLVVVAEVRGSGGAPGVLEQAADLLAGATAARGARPLVVVRHGEVVALVAVPADGAAAVVERVRGACLAARDRHLELVAGASASFTGFGGVGRGYQEAERALALATRAAPVADVSTVPALDYLLAATDATTRAVLEAKAARMQLRDGDRALVEETVATYAAESLNVARSARRLGLHANTMHYRLQRVADLTGLDPRRFADLVELQCVLRAAGEPA